ncbi:hypothetical protein M3C58_12810 [Brachybacterium muris]|uniref:hypothetical protein n=1 Tax=Brachybacterium muris TaxID=219301 RepID=UPI001959F886|nr:hypothetical protein [Brachybacterium muris]MBM7499421.1 hypothetical protein [Brachybacterium muris]MCT1999056.1 hypothetical protein [Brachybacterium muris]
MSQPSSRTPRAAGPSDSPAPVAIRLTARRPIGGIVVGVIRAAMDVQLGHRVAELHLASPGHAGRRIEVREGQLIEAFGHVLQVAAIHPYNGRDPAGVELVDVTGAGPTGAGLG